MMRIKKYFERSYKKRHSFSNPFSSWSTSSSSSSVDGNGGGEINGNEKDTKNRRRRRRKPSWWKWHSPASPAQGGSKTRNARQYQSGNKKSKGKRKNLKCNENNAEDPETQHNHPPPPRSFLQSASSELQKAIDYFEIDVKNDFTREYIKKKYKRSSLIHHPDRNGNNETSIQEMQKINHYFELLEEELNRLDEMKARNDHDDEVDDPPTSGNNSVRKEKPNGRNPRKNKEGYRRRQRRQSHRRTESVTHPRRSSVKHACRESFRQSKRTSPRRRRRRRNHREHRNHKRERRKKERRTSKNQWEESLEMFNNFRAQQRRLRRENNSRYLREQLETVWGREKAYDVYKRRMDTHRKQSGSITRDGSWCQEFTADDKVETLNKPKYALMDCCNEDVVIAMRLKETRIAIHIIDHEVKNATEEWRILKKRMSLSSDANSEANKSVLNCGLSVRLDKSYHNRILEVLTRPLDEDRNTVLHYAVYMENYEVIAYLTQVARRYNIFARFLVCANNRNLMAHDFLAGCTSKNCSVHTFVTTLTNEALVLLKEKQEVRYARGSKMMGRYLTDSLRESMFNFVLYVLVGRYVVRSGWLTSSAIIALAQFADCESLCVTHAATNSARAPKAVFFALHTGRYLLLRFLSTSKDLIATLCDSIPLPWQLKLVIVAMIIPQFAQLRQPPVRSIAYALIKIEAALIAGFDWILSKNSNFHFSSRTLQTMADFVLLSIAFLAVQSMCDGSA